MPPVPVFIDEPITPQKPKGITPQTAAPISTDESANASTTTAQAPYPAARPGQGPPAPTPYAPQPQALPQPSRTTAAAYDNGPPPPQPGAVPVAPSQQASSTLPSTLPPPPKAGEVAPTTTMPPQMGIPAPQQNYAPVYGTSSATTTPQRPGPTTLNFGAAPAPQIQAGSHPPGYQQNVMAQEMSSTARASLEQQDQRRPSIVPNLNIGGDSANDTAGNMWNAVKGWASAAGSTIAETEKEVWKRINRDT
ncbi:uncharacterized protein RCC_08505 [Ramularia collo-cygni]|uniref:Uncharacterized protein n=1 Tax=Ramularia collo-cygni TaxID=112498 RepID=A0A2D3VHY8_9PEZI|nr:uncharacterized protein RCC_08505 [Ramularia collo-cygni]CZT22799.1 uncharacterized protein RCC_08505 [Ramularia collo-cygni]